MMLVMTRHEEKGRDDADYHDEDDGLDNSDDHGNDGGYDVLYRMQC